MYHHLHSLALLCLLRLCTSFTSQTHQAGSFSVDRIRNTNYTTNGAMARRKTFNKMGWNSRVASPAHDALFEARVKEEVKAEKLKSRGLTQNGKVTATPSEYHEQYICPVTIGGQTLNLDFDSGSSDLWVFSTYLPKPSIGTHTVFNSSESQSFVLMKHYTWKILYGDGSEANGIVGTDIVQVGTTFVKSQTVELATAISEEFIEDLGSDGLVGLGFSTFNSVKPKAQKTFFENIVSSLKAPVFTADLLEDGSGFYQFGVIDDTKYTGNLTRLPIDSSRGYWQFNSTTFSINGNVNDNIGASPAIADTGTSLLIVDNAVAEQYYAQVPSSGYSQYYGGFIFLCAETLPPFGMSLGEEYMAIINGTLLKYAAISTRWCYGGLQPNLGNGIQVYGDILFRSEFVVFEQYSDFVGLAVAPKRY